MNILDENPDISCSITVSEDEESFKAAPYLLRQCPLITLRLVDDEYTKILQGADAHSTEYVTRFVQKLLFFPVPFNFVLADYAMNVFFVN